MSQIRQYIAILRKEEGSDYWVSVPDIPGCASNGKTEDEAMINFQEALALHIEALRVESFELPEPRNKEDVLSAENFSYLKAYPIEVEAV